MTVTRDEFLARLDAEHTGWRDMPPLPEMSAETTNDFAAYLEQIADELADMHDEETLHGVFVSLDNTAGVEAEGGTVNTFAAVVALLHALELFREQDVDEGEAPDHSRLIANYQQIAAEFLQIEAHSLREIAKGLPDDEPEP